MKNEIYMISIKIPINIYTKKYVYILEDSAKYKYKDKYMYGFYAWTDNEKYLEDFLSIRYNDIFKINIKKMSNKEFNKFEKEYSNQKLSNYKYSYYSKNKKLNMDIISTLYEYKTSQDDEFTYSYFIDSEINNIHNYKYTKSIEDSLNIIENYLNNEVYKIKGSGVDKLLYLFRFMFIGKK